MEKEPAPSEDVRTSAPLGHHHGKKSQIYLVLKEHGKRDHWYGGGSSLGVCE